ncbi:cobyric acid synthase CobQ, partial [bacterium]|nr:cobyric acid synthase CobQ [bacterium]
VIGICGGFQMLGKKIIDPYRIESEIGESEGLGILDLATVIGREKITSQSVVRLEGAHYLLKGYEIHMGRTERVGENAVPFSYVIKRNNSECNEIDGYRSFDGMVWGTYLHGIFDNEDFLKELITYLYKRKGLEGSVAIRPIKEIKASIYNELARAVRSSLDIESIYRIIGIR